MDDACDGRAASVVDVGHGAGDGARGGDAAEKRGEQVGGTLCDELGVGVVAVTGHAVGYGGREERFDGPQYGDGEGGGQQAAHGLPVDRGQGCGGQLRADGETVADGVDPFDTGIAPEQPDPCREQHDGYQRAWDAAHETRRDDDQQDAQHPHQGVQRIDRRGMPHV